MSRTDHFRRQHDVVQDSARQLVAMIDDYRSPDDSYGLAVQLAKLAGLVRVHLAQEDTSLYPAMIACGDPVASRLAERFAAEMGDLAESLERFTGRWSSSSLIATDFDEFKAALYAFLAALDDRIARENEQLYPLAELIAGGRPSAAA